MTTAISNILRPIFFYDCEVDGINHETVNITEAALRKAENRRSCAVYASKPERANSASSFSKAIPDGMKRWPFQHVMEKLASFFKTQSGDQKSIVMGFNVHGWDGPVLEKNCQRFNVTPPSLNKWQWFDLADVAQALGYPRGTTQQQLEVGLKLSPDTLPANRHRALADTLVVKRIWERMTQNIKNNEEALRAINAAFDGREPEKAVANLLKHFDPTLIPTPQAVDLINQIKAAEKAKRKPIVVLYDTETTGLIEEDEHYNVAPRVVQFAAEILSPHKEKFSSYVDPEMPIPLDATAIHHITDDMVRGKDKFGVMWEQFTTWVKASRTFQEMVAQNKKQEDFEPQIILVGYNNNRYDNILLQQEALRVGIDLKRSLDKGVMKSWDALPLMMTWFSGNSSAKRPENHKLTSVAQALNVKIPRNAAHTANGDVTILKNVLKKICKPLDPATVIKHCVAHGIQFSAPGLGVKAVIEGAQYRMEGVDESQEDSQTSDAGADIHTILADSQAEVEEQQDQSQIVEDAIKEYLKDAADKPEKRQYGSRKRKAEEALPDTQYFELDSQNIDSGGKICI